jgi:hypothetical protein
MNYAAWHDFINSLGCVVDALSSSRRADPAAASSDYRSFARNQGMTSSLKVVN